MSYLLRRAALRTQGFKGVSVLLTTEVEARTSGASDFAFGPEDVHLMATDGLTILLRV